MQQLLERAAKQAQPIMMFISNPDMTQICSGTVKKVQASGEWFNVLEPEVTCISFNWYRSRLGGQVLAKDGPITSVEFCDANGEYVVNFFSKRD